jgi:hypothetical protein
MTGIQRRVCLTTPGRRLAGLAAAALIAACGGEETPAESGKVCALQNDCTEEGELCDMAIGRCVKRSFSVDASASLDGSPGADANSADIAGQDGGKPDSALTDSSLPDTAQPDAAKLDSAQPDVQALDSGDAAQADVNPADVLKADAQDAGADTAGGCTQDDQCPGDGQCLAGVCDAGVCTQVPMYGCCVSGPCCDPLKHIAKPLGTACGDQAIASEWACKGADIQQRIATPGCDGKLTDICPTSPDLANWGPWQTVSTCPAQSQCQQAAPGQKPVCSSGTVAQCLENLACEDGNACTKDSCVGEKCASAPAAAGTACGSQAIASEYKCSGSGAGSDVLVRKAVAGCDGAGSCDSTKQVWGPWELASNCTFSEVCQVSDAKTPGTCVGAPDCTPGSACCTAKGTWVEKGGACGTSTVATEYQCLGSAGGQIQTRTAVAGCSGYGSSCSSYYPAWGAWTTQTTCKANQICTESYSTSLAPTCKAACTAGSTCCTADGTFAAKGTICGTTAWDSETKCSGTAKGAQILERKAYAGCLGASTTCSYSSSDYGWTDWKPIKTCLSTEVCELDSWGDAKCASAVKCTPGSKCCTSEGLYAGSKVSCGSAAFATEYSCSGPEKGGKVLKRTADYGCSNTAASCSYDKADYVWGAWSTYDQCLATEVCEADSWGANCVNAIKCTAGSQCCTADSAYAPVTQACGTSIAASEYKCAGTAKGSAIEKRTASYACSGTSTSCSYNSANYIWGAWKADSSCTAAQYCIPSSYPSVKPYCSTTPP